MWTKVFSMSTRAKTALSLFSSGGIGDLALTANGYKIVVSNELLDDRHAVFQANNPETACISGSILDNSDRIFDATQKSLAGANLDLFYATPPCQGMSKNGRGKLLNAIRAGSKPRKRSSQPTHHSNYGTSEEASSQNNPTGKRSGNGEDANRTSRRFISEHS